MKYFDYAATSELDVDVLEKISRRYNLRNCFYNPSSLYEEGIRSKEILTESRSIIADCLKCKPSEIIFTSGGTESNNMALMGIFLNDLSIIGHIITTRIEHPSIKNTCRILRRLGWEITYLPVDEYGHINLRDLKEAIQRNTKLISIMTINNEIGISQQIEEISEIAREHNIPFHSDCVQTIPFLELNFDINNYDMISLSGHKFGAFAGTGILFKREGIELQPLIDGGGQEFGLRSGTENVFGNLFMAKCLEKSMAKWSSNFNRICKLNIEMAKNLLRKYNDKITVNGCISNILNISFANLYGRVIQSLMAQKGFSISTGSACSSNGDEINSYVIESLKKDKKYTNGTIRISTGFDTKKKDINKLYKELTKTVDYLYEMESVK